MPPTDLEMKTLPRADPLWTELCIDSLTNELNRYLQSNYIPNPTPYTFHTLIPLLEESVLSIECSERVCHLIQKDLNPLPRVSIGRLALLSDRCLVQHEERMYVARCSRMRILSNDVRSVAMYSCVEQRFQNTRSVAGTIAFRALLGEHTVSAVFSRPVAVQLYERRIDIVADREFIAIVSLNTALYKLLQTIHGIKILALGKRVDESCPRLVVRDPYTLCSYTDHGRDYIETLIYNPVPRSLNAVLATVDSIIDSVVLEGIEFPAKASVVRIPMEPEGFRRILIKTLIVKR